MSKFTLKHLGINIKQYRKKKGLSQERLAEIINCSRNYVGMIERAEVNVPTGTVIKIAEVLNVDIKELFEA